MLVNNKPYQTIWYENDQVYFIQQNDLPFYFKIKHTSDFRILRDAIITMDIRGAGAIGVAAAWALALAVRESEKKADPAIIDYAFNEIRATRPTAYDLFHATDFVYKRSSSFSEALKAALYIQQKNIDDARAIAGHGESLITQNSRILTHCNAGWLAFADWGSALATIYLAARNGKKPFVYVDETRPRLQGARLTAWELQNEKIDFKIISDNAAAYFMSKGAIDLVITGADRIAMNGDVANKIGTLQKALAAKYYGIPFYVAAPLSTFDPSCEKGCEITIELRSEDEVLYVEGEDIAGTKHRIRIATPGAEALNPAFDISPSELIHGIITPKGIIRAKHQEILSILE